ncbi:MAG: phosphoribosylaminoimidazolesuccinocarboxamide synthase [Dialister sp.]|nr:phosphoribosylaminoimidazolesuccinocarboxamide synthase [Dialister sp.]
MKEYKPFKSGKVRELYDLGDSLVMVCTDRISAFDNILDDPIPEKGVVLNKMSEFWFDFTKHIVPNHMISIDTKDMPEFFRTPAFEGRSMKTLRLDMIPVECIVRGYITGSGWEGYRKDGKVCGIPLPEGLKECQKLPKPIFTPSTKAPVGEHDLNISFDEGVEWVNRFFPGKGEEYMKKLGELTLALYKACADYALTKGIIIADTKFEFGLDEKGRIILADEMLTPDNSRFWPVEGYEPGHGQPSYDKQFVRDYLRDNPGDTVPAEIIDKTIGKYKEAYELLTGKII